MSDSQTSQDVPGLEFLRFVLEGLVDDPSALHIEGARDDLGILLTVRVGDSDMGKLIGKGGQTVKALRVLLRILGGNLKERINLKILEPTDS